MLTFASFPLYAIGQSVYPANVLTVLFTAATPEMAADVVFRLNRDHYAAFGSSRSDVHSSPLIFTSREPCDV